MSARRIVRVTITGRVQGVGFRAWTQHQAELHGLDGWVRNRRDHSVEAVFAGPPEAVAVMLKVCGQGPRGSDVQGLHVVEADEAALAERPEVAFAFLPTG
jgi:acylphosphatase